MIISEIGIGSLLHVGERLVWEEVDKVVDLSMSLEQRGSRADEVDEDELSSKCTLRIATEGINKEVSDIEVRSSWT